SLRLSAPCEPRTCMGRHCLVHYLLYSAVPPGDCDAAPRPKYLHTERSNSQHRLVGKPPWQRRPAASSFHVCPFRASKRSRPSCLAAPRPPTCSLPASSSPTASISPLPLSHLSPLSFARASRAHRPLPCLPEHLLTCQPDP